MRVKWKESLSKNRAQQRVLLQISFQVSLKGSLLRASRQSYLDGLRMAFLKTPQLPFIEHLIYF